MSIAYHSELLSLDLQFFSEEFAPSEPTEPTEPTESTEPTPEEAPVTTQEEFDVIKYNKEEIKIPVAERQTYLQKGYNYDKVQQRVSDYEQRLQEIASITGYQSVEELLSAAEEAKRQQAIQQEAQRMGIDEESYQRYYQPVQDELSTVKQELEALRTENIRRQIDAELATLEKNPEFPKYEVEMYSMAEKYGMTLTEAFEFASLRGLKEQIPSLQQQAEQKVVDQIRSRQGKHVETHDENAVVSLNLTPEEVKMAQNLGISPEEYAKWK